VKKDSESVVLQLKFNNIRILNGEDRVESVFDLDGG
jgi:hypothetical protein